MALLLTPLTLPAARPVNTLEVYVEGEVLVKYRPESVPGVQAQRDLGFVTRRRLMDGRLELLEIPRFTTVRQALEVLEADPSVEYAEPNFRRFPRASLPSDPLFPDQWGLHSTGQANFASDNPDLASIPGADMDMLAAWDPDGDGSFDRVGDGSVTVAVIDDSVATEHPDLAANIVAGFDFADNDSNPNPDPGSDQFHGTLVAGCIGAVGNNGIGVAGTAWNVKLMPLKFSFNTATFLEAMEFARNRGVGVINASFGGPSYSQAEVDALADLASEGILFVAAAGNDDSNTDVAQLNYPANYPGDNIVSVAANNRQDDIASFSQYGPLTVDVAAPGLQIVTTASQNGYSTRPGVAGTSFASPYTAGIAALLRMQFPSAGFREIKARLIEGAEAGGNVRHRTVGGRINAARSLDLTPRPSLVIRELDWIDTNGALDAGETIGVDITVANLWNNAANVVGTLTADQGVTVNNGAVSFGSIPAQGAVQRRFEASVPSGITDHRYVNFTLSLSADDGYTVTRNFIAEIGDLSDAGVTQSFAPRSENLYDEFHAWHYDLTTLSPDHDQLVIETKATADVDLLVKKGWPPQYNITVGINPETDGGFFCTSGTTLSCQDPETRVSASATGNEAVVFDDPGPGTYHIVVVNFAQLEEGLGYTLRAYTRATPPPAEQPGNGGSGGSGGSGWTMLAPLIALWALRRRPQSGSA